MNCVDAGDEDEPDDAETGAVDDDQEEYRAPPEAEHSEDSETVGDEDDANGANTRGTCGPFNSSIQVWGWRNSKVRLCFISLTLCACLL